MNTTAKRPAKASPRLSRRQKILQLFIAGTRVEAIAKDLEMSPKQVEKTLSKELKNLVVRPAGDFVNVQLARIERLLGVLSVSIEKGELKAIQPYLRALDRAERLYGFQKRLGLEYQSTANDGREAVEKITRLMLTANPKLFSDKT
jgi:hypothetical protein